MNVLLYTFTLLTLYFYVRIRHIKVPQVKKKQAFFPGKATVHYVALSYILTLQTQHRLNIDKFKKTMAKLTGFLSTSLRIE